MVRKLPIFIFLFVFPVIYLPLLLSGYAPRNGIFPALALCIGYGLIITSLNPLATFLTLRGNIVIKLAFAAILIFGVHILFQRYTGFIAISPDHFSLGYGSFSTPALQLNEWVTNAIASLLLALWGIIMNILLR